MEVVAIPLVAMAGLYIAYNQDKKDRSVFIRKIATDLCSSLRDLPTGGRLIFTADSRSWRKKIEIEDGGYKSDRVKDEKVDWTIFFDLIQ